MKTHVQRMVQDSWIDLNLIGFYVGNLNDEHGITSRNYWHSLKLFLNEVLFLSFSVDFRQVKWTFLQFFHARISDERPDDKRSPPPRLHSFDK